jgi:hypothetical protein
MRLYVEKLVHRKPVSLVGPFRDEAEAQSFKLRAMVEETRSAAERWSRGIRTATNVEYRIIPETEVDT